MRTGLTRSETATCRAASCAAAVAAAVAGSTGAGPALDMLTTRAMGDGRATRASRRVGQSERS